MKHDPYHHTDSEKGCDLQQDHQHIGAGARHTGDNGKGHDAQHVVDDGGAQNGVARTGGQLPNLLQSLYRDADGGGGQDHADKDVLQEGVSSGIEEAGQREAACQRDQNTDEGDDESGCACLLQFAQVSLQTGVKHENNNTQFRQLVHQCGFLKHAQHSGAQQQSGQQRADNLGQCKTFGYNSQDLGAQQDDRDFK